MKKVKILLTTLSLITAFGASAQMDTAFVSKRANSKGSIIIDAYYSVPNIYSFFFRVNYEGDGYYDGNERVHGLGPLGGRVEYMVTNHIGLGVDVGYNNSVLEFDRETYYYDPNSGLDVPVTYNYKYSTEKLGVIATFNYHFLNKENFDFYVTGGLGYGQRVFREESTDPGFADDLYYPPFPPIAFKVGTGVRYYFNRFVGINAGLSIGQGWLVNGGLTFKI